ncbi:MAG: hypothetical protein AB1742_12995 [bacterium]
MATDVGAVGSVTSPGMTTGSTTGRQASIVQATLARNAEQQEIARRPLKIPDTRLFGIMTNVDMVI